MGNEYPLRPAPKGSGNKIRLTQPKVLGLHSLQGKEISHSSCLSMTNYKIAYPLPTYTHLKTCKEIKHLTDKYMLHSLQCFYTIKTWPVPYLIYSSLSSDAFLMDKSTNRNLRKRLTEAKLKLILFYTVSVIR